MIFVRATIDGFGKWTDTSFDFSQTGLHCFYGENESGKSTLQQFLLYMLFGLPPRKRKEFTPKLRQGIGGTLTISHETAGVITLKRTEGECACWLENGDKKDESWWFEQLDTLNRDVYTSIYAFSATDLGMIQTMKKSDLSNVLFSVGLTGSTAIYEAEKTLMTKLDLLYKKQGRKPIINEQMIKVDEINKQLAQWKEKEAGYQDLLEQITILEQQSVERQSSLNEVRKELLLLEKKKQALPNIQLYRTYKEKLSSIQDDLTFPEQGLARLQELKEAMMPIKSELRLLEKHWREMKNKYDVLQEQRQSVETVQHAKELLTQESAYEKRKYEIEHHKKAWNELKAAFYDLLQQLEWEEDQTENHIFPFHLETTWQDLQRGYREWSEEETRLKENQHVLAEKKARLVREEKECRAALLPAKEMEQITFALNNDQLQKERKGQLAQWHQLKSKQKQSTKNGLMLAGMLVLISFILALFMDNPIFYGLPLLILISAGVHYLYRAHQTNTIGKIIHAEPSAELTESERTHFTAQVARQQELEQHLAQLTNDLRQVHFSEIQLDENQHILAQRETVLMDKIESERFQYPFLNEIDIGHWLELLKKTRELRDIRGQLQQAENTMNQLQEKNHQAEQQLETFLGEKSFRALRGFIEKEQQYERLAEQYEQDMKEYEQKQTEKKSLLEEFQADLKELFNTAHVHNEEAFYEKSSLLEQKKGYEEGMEQIELQLSNSFSTIKDLLDEDINETALESTEIRFQEKLADLEQQASSDNKELVTLEMKIKDLEASEDVSNLAHRLHLEKELLNEKAKEWAALKISQSALQNAKESFQQHHLDEVMRWTTTYFAQLTGGKYVTVYPPTASALFQVEGKNDLRYTVDELSQGTIDQLYVALRFAMAKVMSFNMPLLVDDAFVHFDDVRTEQAITLLAHIAEEQQIIFFTCKKRVAEVIEQQKENSTIKTFS